MTRRIAITILLTVWTAIVCAGLAAWWTARAILLSDLDHSVVRRALALPGVGGSGAVAGNPGDRYVVKGQYDQTLGRGAGPGTAPAQRAEVLSADFVNLPEGSFRRLTLRVQVPGAAVPATVVYSAPAAEFGRVLRRLATALTVCGAVAGVAAAAGAARIARIALRPLSRAADVLGSVNETSLDRRIEAASLPEELRPMASQLNRMLERLQNAFEQRRRFIADASHELRTPVAAMITTMEVATRRPRPETELLDTLQICLSEARHMRQLVQGLMRQVRAEAAVAEPVEEFDAARVVRECTELARPLADEHRVNLVNRVDGVIQVRSEPGRLRSVVMNLVSNAIEYNRPGGTVEVFARCEADSAEIMVRDDGPGIAEDHVGSLFQPFYRVDRARNADGHLGLGLCLVDSHVKAMGGECRVESRLGSGTTFRVRLPVIRPEAVEAGAE